MWEYVNGNYLVKILADGTKIRIGDAPKPIFPESIDLKITNKCGARCGYCHEESVPEGQDASIEWTEALLQELPGGVEIALGGGNPLEVADGVNRLIQNLPELIFNVTVNSQHLKDVRITPNAFGVSYNKKDHQEIVKFDKANKNTVIHLIAGVHYISDLERCCNEFERVLVLGYKQFGRGTAFYSQAVLSNLTKWRQHIGLFFGKGILAFDNLAIEQLYMRRFFTKEKWTELYMGDDGDFSMYIDAVKKQYAKSSISTRNDCNALKISEMFHKIWQHA